MDKITKGCIYDIFNNNGQTKKDSVVVQTIHIKNITRGDKTKYRLLISDGTHYMNATVAEKHHELIKSGILKEYTILKLNEFSSFTLADMLMINIIDCEVCDGGYQKIGTPISVYKVNNSGVQKSVVDTSDCQPIECLNPYNNNWSIKVRVTRKNEMKTWDNSKGSGKLFSVDLLDNHGGQIRATMFNDEATKYFDIFQESKVYKISKGAVKLANRRFNHLPCDYELTLSSSSIVQEVPEDKTIDQIKYIFVPIDSLHKVQPNKYVDIIGVVHEIGPQTTITTKSGKEVVKRTVTIVDSSLLSVDVTLWNQTAITCNEDHLSNNPILAMKSLKVGDFGGRSLSFNFGSQIKVNPNLPQAEKLKKWFADKGKTASFTSVSRERNSTAYPRTPIKDANNLGTDINKPDTFTMQGYIIHFQLPNKDHEKPRMPWYPACPSAGCKKKIIEDQGMWRCEKCNSTYPEPKYLWVLAAVIADDTESMWVTLFNDIAEKIIKRKASDVKKIYDQQGTKALQKIFKECLFTNNIFAVRAATQAAVNSEFAPKVRRVAVGLRPINYRNEISLLLENIETMEQNYAKKV